MLLVLSNHDLSPINSSHFPDVFERENKGIKKKIKGWPNVQGSHIMGSKEGRCTQSYTPSREALQDLNTSPPSHKAISLTLCQGTQNKGGKNCLKWCQKNDFTCSERKCDDTEFSE